MRYPGTLVISVLETMSYETWLTITHFPCSVSIRQELANCLVDVGFIYRCGNRYSLTEIGEEFLNNVKKQNTI